MKILNDTAPIIRHPELKLSGIIVTVIEVVLTYHLMNAWHAYFEI